MDLAHPGVSRVYLASPYWHPDRNIRALRAESARVACLCLVEQGFFAYSPIVHGYAMDPDETLGGNLWLDHCLGLIPAFDVLLILRLQGWEASKGVSAEVSHAVRSGLRVAMTEVPEAPLRPS